MQPYQQQTQRYERRPQPGNPAATESWALIEAAKRLAQSITDTTGSKKEINDRRKAALRLNWRLWTIFQADLTAERTDVPRDLRLNMLTLCQFVDKHTVSVMAKPSPEAISTLIDINRNIAAGLAQVPEEPQPQETVASPGASVAVATEPPPEQPVKIDTEI